MDNLSKTEQLAKEMTEYCAKLMISVQNSVPPSLLVVIIALAGADPDKSRGAWALK